MRLLDWWEEIREHEAAHAAMLRYFGWSPKVELGLVPEWDDGHLARVTVDGPDGHDWSPLVRSVVSYAPAVVVFGGSDWESDAFATDRANVEAAMPSLCGPFPDAWLSKVHDETQRIVVTDEYRLHFWEELQKLRRRRRPLHIRSSPPRPPW